MASTEDDEALLQIFEEERRTNEEFIGQIVAAFPFTDPTVIRELIEGGIGVDALLDILQDMPPQINLTEFMSSPQNNESSVTMGSSVELLEPEPTRVAPAPRSTRFDNDIPVEIDEKEWNQMMLIEKLWSELMRRWQSPVLIESKPRAMIKESTTNIKYFLRDQFPEISMPAVLSVIDRHDFYSAMIILKMVALGDEDRLFKRNLITKRMMPMRLSEERIVQRRSEASDIREPVPEPIARFWNNYMEILNGDFTEGLAALRFDCPICLDAVPESKGINCTALLGDEELDHRFCAECVRGQALASNDVQIGKAGTGLPCMEDKCKGVILWARVRRLLSEEENRFLDKRVDIEAINAANMKDLVKCQQCPYGEIITASKEEQSVFNCRSCNYAYCRLCEKIYDEKHMGRKCGQYESEQEEARKKLEEDLTMAVIRQCECGLQFQKVEGCNFMTCSNCHRTQCYLCKEKNIASGHFSNGRCNQFTSNDFVDQRDRENRDRVLNAAKGVEMLKEDDLRRLH